MNLMQGYPVTNLVTVFCKCRSNPPPEKIYTIQMINLPTKSTEQTQDYGIRK